MFLLCALHHLHFSESATVCVTFLQLSVISCIHIQTDTKVSAVCGENPCGTDSTVAQ